MYESTRGNSKEPQEYYHDVKATQHLNLMKMYNLFLVLLKTWLFILNVLVEVICSTK